MKNTHSIGSPSAGKFLGNENYTYMHDGPIRSQRWEPNSGPVMVTWADDFEQTPFLSKHHTSPHAALCWQPRGWSGAESMLFFTRMKRSMLLFRQS